MSVRKRKILKYILSICCLKDNTTLPANNLKDCFEHIIDLKPPDRKIEDDSTNRIHYLHTLKFMQLNYLNYWFGLGYFASAKHHHRPPLLDAVSLKTRNNPKKPEEGELEKTHFALGFKEDETFLLIEKKHGGMTPSRLFNHLENHIRKLFGKDKRLKSELIVNENFLDRINAMSRITIAEVYIDKDVLTETFSEVLKPHTTIRNTIKLTINATRSESIPKRIISNFYEKFSFNAADRKIKRLRVHCMNSDNVPILIDTEKAGDSDIIEVELDENYQVRTESILPQLRQKIKSMLVDRG